MKYKVGDKVKVRDDLLVGNSYGYYTYYGDMVNFRSKIVTIKTVNDYGFYRIEEDRQAGYWTAEMFEDDFEDDKEVSTSTEAEIAKFRAFLEEVVDCRSDEYTEQYMWLSYIMGIDIVDDDEKMNEIIKNLCDFYRTFTPKVEEPPRKEMTLEEIEAELGYKIKVVE